jgi:hypothetical protein
MRLRILGLILAYVGAAAMGSLGVEAKQIRAAFMLVGVDDTNARIVKVLDLPDVPMLKREDGRYIDLGYKWGTSGDGQWVGYIDSSTSYVPLTKELRATLMMVGAIKEMPPAPKRPRSFNYWPLLVFLGLIVAMSKAISAFKIVSSQAREKSPDLPHRHFIVRDKSARSRRRSRRSDRARRQACRGKGRTRPFGRVCRVRTPAGLAAP